jgi:hypothetical protein
MVWLTDAVDVVLGEATGDSERVIVTEGVAASDGVLVPDWVTDEETEADGVIEGVSEPVTVLVAETVGERDLVGDTVRDADMLEVGDGEGVALGITRTGQPSSSAMVDGNGENKGVACGRTLPLRITMFHRNEKSPID